MSRLHQAEATPARFLRTPKSGLYLRVDASLYADASVEAGPERRVSENRVHFSARCASVSASSVPIPVMLSMAQFQFFDDTTSPAQGPEHIAKLRAEMARRGFDGFVVPRADEHQGEYVPKSAERLAWLTGFTGSAGTAVVLQSEAALVVDGRYTVQAAEQVDTSVDHAGPARRFHARGLDRRDTCRPAACSPTIRGFIPATA